jgi:hypothetical protein
VFYVTFVDLVDHSQLRNDDSRRLCSYFVLVYLFVIMPRDGAQTLSDVLSPVLAVVCEPRGRLVALIKPPPNLRVTTQRWTLHHNISGALQVSDQPLRDDVSHEGVRVPCRRRRRAS